MTDSLTVTVPLHFQREFKGRKAATAIRDPLPLPLGRVPRLARLLALAHKLERMVHGNEVEDFATLARLGHVTRARMSQIVSLINLASDIQDDILHLPLVFQGRDPIIIRDVLPIARQLDWSKQRVMWRQLRSQRYPTANN